MSPSMKSSRTNPENGESDLGSNRLIKKRFHRGFRRYIKKNYSYGWKAFAHRVQYRKEV